MALGGLCGGVAVTAWLLGASSSAEVEIAPIAAAPPQAGAVASPAPLSRLVGHGARVHALLAPGTPQDAYLAWANEMTGLTGVPARALEAYAAASQRVDLRSPDCHLDWSTLAGLGSVESLIGQDGGGLRPDGRPVVAIYGPSLDGKGKLASVADTDHGSVDGDPTVDRAVGPLQFLPSTWRLWGTDGDADGVSDPQDIDDAALTAARYLCAAGDLGTPAGWTDAIFSYNHSDDYVQSAYTATNQIAAASRG